MTLVHSFANENGHTFVCGKSIGIRINSFERKI